MYKKFLKDPFYLTKYHALFATALFLVNAGLLWLRTPTALDILLFLPAIWFGSQSDLRIVLGTFLYACAASAFSPSFDPIFFLAIVPAILVSFPLFAMIHNPSHDSLSPRWLNRPVGEFTGLFHMIGFPDWQVIHVFHHQYTDDPALDPHPPGKKGYWEFALGMRQSATNAFVRHFLRIHGDGEGSMRALKLFSRVSRIDMLMRATFWFLVLGPSLYATFFMASLAFKMLHYAWFNHSTHRFEGDKAVIKNLNDHWAYKFINLISLNIYYHDNHHAKPSLANARKLIPAESQKKAS